MQDPLMRIKSAKNEHCRVQEVLSKTHRVVFEPFDGAACANHNFRGKIKQ